MAVAAPVGAAGERVAEAEDRLADAEDGRLPREECLVTEPPKLVGAVPEARLERDLPPFLDAEASGIQRCLWVGSFAEGMDELDVSLRLHRAAHDAEGPEELAFLEEHPR